MYKKELFYTILVFIALEALTLSQTLNQYILATICGLLVIIVWSTTTFLRYSHKKVSKYSEEVIKHRFKIRWYQYLFVPAMFFLSLAAYIFFIKQDYMRQLIIFVGSISHFILFVHTRSTYERFFAFSRVSKVAFDLINVIFFFVVANVLVASGLFTFELVVGVLAIVCAAILTANLLLSREFSAKGFLFALFASLVLFITGLLSKSYFFTKFAFIETVVFYMIISVWHIKMMGERQFSKYLSPILFALMALILIAGK